MDDIVDEEEDEELHAEQTNQQQLQQAAGDSATTTAVVDIEDVVVSTTTRVTNSPLDKSRCVTTTPVLPAAAVAASCSVAMTVTLAFYLQRSG